MGKYFNSSTSTNTFVSFKLVSSEGIVITASSVTSCFAAITYNTIPRWTKLIIFHHLLKEIPYTEDTIRMWVKELNDLGFPCKVMFGNEEAIFTVRLSDFVWKAHVNATLMLLRCLTETYICNIPDIYFTKLDEDPKVDRFDLLQTAHKQADQGFANYNHMVCSMRDGTSGNITKDLLMQRFADTGVKVFDHHTWRQVGQSALWRAP